MIYRHIGLLYFATLHLIGFGAIFLLGYAFVLGGFMGVGVALPLVGTALGLAVLVLGIVPLLSALLITAVSLLVTRRFAERRETLSHHWILSAGASLIVWTVACLGAEIYFSGGMR